MEFLDAYESETSTQMAILILSLLAMLQGPNKQLAWYISIKISPKYLSLDKTYQPLTISIHQVNITCNYSVTAPVHWQHL